MPRWKGLDEIIGKALICVFRREDTGGCPDTCRTVEMELGQRGADIHILDALMLPISSSMIRSKAARGESIREFVCPSVSEYIERYGLYPKDPARTACEVQTKLKSFRLGHGKAAASV